MSQRLTAFATTSSGAWAWRSGRRRKMSCGATGSRRGARAIIVADAESSVAIRGVPNARLQRAWGSGSRGRGAPAGDGRRARACPRGAQQRSARPQECGPWRSAACRCDHLVGGARMLRRRARRGVLIGSRAAPLQRRRTLAADDATRWQGYASFPIRAAGGRIAPGRSAPSCGRVFPRRCSRATS